MTLWKIILGISIAIISLVSLFIGWALLDENIPDPFHYGDYGKERRPTKKGKKKIIQGSIMIIIAIIGVIVLYLLTQ